MEKNNFETKTFKVFSYCELPDEIVKDNKWRFETVSCDTYIDFTVETEEGECTLSEYLVSMGASIRDEVLIHIDY